MLLIADSGSTKTDWALVSSSSEFRFLHTQGLNPVMETEEQICQILRNELLPEVTETVDAIYFYGAGCTPEKCPLMEAALRKVFPKTETIEAQSDLMGAARAVCQHSEGIACILGTGANSCLYDGQHIVGHIPPLGYILGDECSGAYLGKRLINGLYKGWLPKNLKEAFEEETHLTNADIIDRVYHQPLANRFLASQVSFIVKHIDRPELCMLLSDSFSLFLKRNIEPYQRKDLPLNFVGGIAWQFQTLFKDVASAKGYRMGTVIKRPIERLIAYHTI